MAQQAAEELLALSEELLESVASDPNQVALVGAIAVLLSLLAIGVWFRFRATKADRFVEALADHDHLAVLMHPNPDPDAMASALAAIELADSPATIQYPGQIRHPENRAFETVLDCEFERIECAADLASRTVVLVDHNEPRGFEGAETVDPHVIVDHHPGNGEGEEFTDVRPERGACASILADYLRDRGWSTDSDDDQTVTPELATALLYGIQSDTTAFTRGCTQEEFDSAAYLFPAANADSLDRIANPEVDGETLDVKARAINNRDVDGSFLVSHVGELSNLDALPTAAEELVRLEGVTVAVVMGERDETVHLSGRSRDDRVHMGKAMETALATVPEASAGGHARMGGGQAAKPPNMTARNEHTQIQSRLFAAMSGEL